MEGQHTVDELRSVLNALRNKIETLEKSPPSVSAVQSKRLSKRIEKAKIYEAAILAKLAKSGVDL